MGIPLWGDAVPCAPASLPQTFNGLIDTFHGHCAAQYLHHLEERRCGGSPTDGCTDGTKELPWLELKPRSQFAHGRLHDRVLPLLKTCQQIAGSDKRVACAWSIHAFLDQSGSIVADFVFIEE